MNYIRWKKVNIYAYFNNRRWPCYCQDTKKRTPEEQLWSCIDWIFSRYHAPVFLSPSHLVLIDINFPFHNGYYWCSQIRSTSQVPIIFISKGWTSWWLFKWALMTILPSQSTCSWPLRKYRPHSEELTTFRHNGRRADGTFRPYPVHLCWNRRSI